MLELRKLSANDGMDVYQLLQEIPLEENGLQNNANGMTFEQFRVWLGKKQQEAEMKEIEGGWKVPTTTFWLYADGVPVGFGKLRHFLTDALRKAGGHIGYGIAPQHRGKGYGNEILRLLIREAAGMGIDKVLLTIRLDNEASKAVALASGGVIAEKTDERYLLWIDTKLS